MSGTDIAYGARSGICLRVRYALFGTDIAIWYYGIADAECYEMSGTDIADDTTRFHSTLSPNA
eukprot:3261770-Rhodomonas_salina.2